MLHISLFASFMSLHPLYLYVSSFCTVFLSWYEFSGCDYWHKVLIFLICVRLPDCLPKRLSYQIRSDQSLSRVWLFATPWIAAARPPCPSPTPGVHWDSRPSSQWYHPAISSSGVPFSSRPQSLPASESFPMSQLFTWGRQSIGVSASASVLPTNLQDWFPLGLTGWISLQSKGLSRIFSSTTIWKHQFFSAQLSLWSDSHICTWLLEKP